MNESSLSWWICCCQGHNSKIKISGKLGITNKFRARTQNLKDWKWRGKPTGHMKTSLGGWDRGNSLPFKPIWPKSHQWRGVQKAKRREFRQSFLRLWRAKLGKCCESHKGSSANLAFYLLTPTTLQSPSLQHPKWRMQTFQDKNKEAGARSDAKSHETERHEVEKEMLSCVGPRQVLEGKKKTSWKLFSHVSPLFRPKRQLSVDYFYLETAQ